MKNKFLNAAALPMLVCMFLMPTLSQSQNKLGIRGGFNASTVSFDNLPSKSERFGYHLGIFADIGLLPGFLSLQPEVSFSTKGTAFKPLNERQTLNMNFVDLYLPVAFKLSSFDLQVGLASYLTTTPNYTVFNDNSVLIDGFKKYDVGLTAGLSYNFSRLFIGVRYNQGFVDVTNDNARVLLGNGKTSVGQVSAGFKF